MIFKAYDIRGVYPEELNEDTAYKIGQAFVEFTKAKNVLVAEDARESTPTLKKSILKGLTDSGANVITVGHATTPMFYFAVATNNQADAGIMITASHNPGKYNGFKMVRKNLIPIGEGSGMEEIKKLVEKDKFNNPETKGTITKTEIQKEYIEKILDLVDVKKIKNLRIAIDTGNGMAGVNLPKLLQNIPQLETKQLFFDIDMSFPNHEANPLNEDTLKDLKEIVLKNDCHLGVAYDGDADRVGFVDEKGEMVRADFIFAAILPELVKNHQTILCDLRCSKVVEEYTKELGAEYQMTRVGHAFIKKQIKDTDAIAAAELSSHFYFKNFYGVECSDLVVLYLLLKISENNKPLSKIVEPLKKYFQSGEINFKVEDKEKIIKKIIKDYKNKAENFTDIDGIRMEFLLDNNWWWLSIRASNTEPFLRLNIEASSKTILKEKIDEITKLIK